jgi:hypothetical protein
MERSLRLSTAEEVITVERDDARQRIIVTGIGTVSISDIRSVMEQQRADGTWHYDLLYDFCGATTTLTGADMQSLANHVGGLQPSARGPVAVATIDLVFYGVARMYSMMTETTGLRFAVFRDRPAAEHWLDEQQARQ